MSRQFVFLGVFLSLAISGCGGMSNMLGPKSQADKDRDKWEADAKAEHDKCVEELDAAQTRFDEAKTALYAKPVASEEDVTATSAELAGLTERVLGPIPSDCSRKNNAKEGTPLYEIYEKYRTPILARQTELDASFRAEYPNLRLDLVKKAVASNAVVGARTAFWTMFQDEATTENDEYTAIAKQIAEQYDKVLLERYKTNGGFANLGAGKSIQGCMYSAKPFPAKFGAVAPVFSSHIDGGKVYVVCRLPQPAKTYETGTDPKLTLQLISENAARTVFVAEVFELGTPAQQGDTVLVRGEFSLPGTNGSFPKYVRFWFDTRVVQGFDVPRAGGGLERRTNVLSQSSFSWHK